MKHQHLIPLANAGLLAFYDFRAEHWRLLRTTTPSSRPSRRSACARPGPRVRIRGPRVTPWASNSLKTPTASGAGSTETPSSKRLSEACVSRTASGPPHEARSSSTDFVATSSEPRTGRDLGQSKDTPSRRRKGLRAHTRQLRVTGCASTSKTLHRSAGTMEPIPNPPAAPLSSTSRHRPGHRGATAIAFAQKRHDDPYWERAAAIPASRRPLSQLTWLDDRMRSFM